MRLLLLYFLVCTCTATNCIRKSVDPKADYNQLNQKKDASKNGKESINGIDNGSLPLLYKAVGLNDL